MKLRFIIILLVVTAGLSIPVDLAGQYDFAYFLEEKGMRNLQAIRDSFEHSIRKLPVSMQNRSRKHFYRMYRHYESVLDRQGNIFNHTAKIRSEERKAARTIPGFMLSDQRATHGQWENITPPEFNQNEPHTGRILRIQGHPTSNTTLFAGTPDGGLWKSTNLGIDWVNLTPGMSNLGISGICVHPSNPDIIYILTGDGDSRYSFCTGVLKTTNGGLDWEETNLTFDESELAGGVQMKMKPGAPNTMFAVMSNNQGIYRTTDGWTTFSQHQFGRSFTDIEFVPGSPDTIYASTWGGECYRSTNGGLSFNQITAFNGTDLDEFPSKTQIAVCTSAPAIVYMLKAWSNLGGNPHYELFLSSDYGESFFLISQGNDFGKQSHINLALEVDPDNLFHVYMGAVELVKSTDGGQTFSNIRTGQNEIGTHVDIHDLMFHGGYFWVASHGGVARSIDNGQNWAKANRGLYTSKFTEIDIYNNKFMGGTQDNGTLTWNIGDQIGQRRLGGDGFECQFDRGAIGEFYASTQHDRFRFLGSSAFVITPSGHYNTWDASWAFHPTNTDTSYCFRQDLFRSYNKGSTWDSIHIPDSALPKPKNVRVVEQGVNDPNVMFISDRFDIAYTQNIHSTSDPVWTNVSNPINVMNDGEGGDNWWERLIGSISLDPEDASKVWVTILGFEETGKVYHSSQFGENGSWTDVTGNLPAVPIKSSVAEPGPNDGIYVGTDLGVFYTNNNLSDWIWFGNGMPRAGIEDMQISDGYLYVATFGSGAWRSPLYSSCPGVVLLNENTNPDPNGLTGMQQHTSSSSISSNQVIYGGPDTDIRFSSGNFVLLYDGFTVKPNTTFEAKIGGCPQ